MAKKLIKDNGGLIFSTSNGELCSKCSKPINNCICKDIAANTIPEGDGVVKIKRETKGRKGSGVTLLTGICLNQSELKQLAKELKKKCGSGGSIKDGVIELQGDVRELTMTILQKKGFKAKICGG